MKATELFNELRESITTLDLEGQIRSFLHLLQQITALDSVYFTRIDINQTLQQIQYAVNNGALEITEGLSVNWEDTLCRRVIEQERVYVLNVAESFPDVTAATELGIYTFVSAPIRLSDGRLYGTICAASSSAVELESKSVALFKLIASIVSMQIEREHLLLQLTQENREFRDIALTDPLTGLPNRRALESELTRALANSRRNGGVVFVAFIDLDNFKQINDQYGHDAGDRFLILMTKSLIDSRREGDFIARVGGDEFIMFGYLTGTQASHSAKVVCQEIFDSTCGRFDIGDTVFSYNGASVGLVVAEPSETVAAVLKRADNEMYQQKKLRQISRSLGA